MFLVKSCTNKYNVLNSKTIRVGTLSEYRETESSQIRDVEEGFFDISFNLIQKTIKISIFNHLNKCHNSDLSAHIENLHIISKYKDQMRLSYQANYRWINRNRFIFCLSRLEKHKKSISIFKDYDDYWYLNYFNKEIFIAKLSENLLNEVKKLLQQGVSIFSEEIINIENLKIKSHSQEIIYGKRDIHIDNENIDLIEKTVIEIFNNIKYIKPIDFKKEKELRIVFDFYYNNILLTPIVKSIIIPENISEFIKIGNI